MSLFGPPNIDNFRKKGSIKKLVKLLTHDDPELASNALIALQQIAIDKELEQTRKKGWFLYEYENIIKKIGKLDNDKQESIKNLTQILQSEKNELDKKNEAVKQERDELKKCFEDSFKSLSGTTDNFFNDLQKILGENKDFLHTMKFPNTRAMGTFSGVIVTKDEIIYFELNVFPKIMCVRLDEIKEFKYGFLNTSIKIKNVFGDYIKIPVEEDDKKLVDFIQTRYQKNIEK